MDPHSFSLLDPDPEEKNVRRRKPKNARKLVIISILF